MRPLAKAALVGGGYIAALAVASVVVAIHVGTTSGPDRQTYGAMFAFGDGLFFLAVLGVASVPATGAALFFSRPYPAVWLVLCVSAAVIAGTSLAALVGNLAPSAFGPRSTFLAFGSLGILIAPLFAMFFLLCGLFAPNRSARLSLIAAAAVEIAVFTYWFRDVLLGSNA